MKTTIELTTNEALSYLEDLFKDRHSTDDSPTDIEVIIREELQKVKSFDVGMACPMSILIALTVKPLNLIDPIKMIHIQTGCTLTEARKYIENIYAIVKNIAQSRADLFTD